MDRTAYKNRHIKEHYDRINLVIPKGCINDITGSRQIHTNKMQELRRIIIKSHKQ